MIGLHVIITKYGRLNLSVMFGCFFPPASQVKVAPEYLLCLFEVYLLQLFEIKGTANWNKFSSNMRSGSEGILSH